MTKSATDNCKTNGLSTAYGSPPWIAPELDSPAQRAKWAKHAAWKPVLGWEGIYEVSYQGELRSVDREVTYSNGSRRIVHGQRKRIHLDRYGYARASLCRPGHAVTAQMHVLVCEAFHGPRPSPEAEVCHANDNRSDNRAENLSWGTRQSNAAEMAERHRIKGEKHPRAQLTAFQAFMIQELPWKKQGRNIRLAKELGVSLAVITMCRSRKNWGWLHTA